MLVVSTGCYATDLLHYSIHYLTELLVSILLSCPFFPLILFLLEMAPAPPQTPTHQWPTRAAHLNHRQLECTTPIFGASFGAVSGPFGAAGTPVASSSSSTSSVHGSAVVTSSMTNWNTAIANLPQSMTSLPEQEQGVAAGKTVRAGAKQERSQFVIDDEEMFVPCSLSSVLSASVTQSTDAQSLKEDEYFVVL